MNPTPAPFITLSDYAAKRGAGRIAALRRAILALRVESAVPFNDERAELAKIADAATASDSATVADLGRVLRDVLAAFATIATGNDRSEGAPVTITQTDDGPVIAPAAVTISDDLATVLRSIVASEYHDGRNPVDRSTWTEGLGHGFTRQKVGGLFNAGKRAGVLGCQRDPADGDTCWITAAGMAALAAHDAAHAPAPAAPESVESAPIAAAPVMVPLADEPAAESTATAPAGDAGWTFADACADAALPAAPAIAATVGDGWTELQIRTAHAILDTVKAQAPAVAAVYMDQVPVDGLGKATFRDIQAAVDALEAAGILDQTGRGTGVHQVSLSGSTRFLIATGAFALPPIPAARPAGARRQAKTGTRALARAAADVAIGTVFAHVWKGSKVTATRTADGFAVGSAVYDTLAKAGKAVTGWNTDAARFWKVDATPATAPAGG